MISFGSAPSFFSRFFFGPPVLLYLRDGLYKPSRMQDVVP